MNLIQTVFYGCSEVVAAYKDFRVILKNEKTSGLDIRDGYLKLLEEMTKDLGYKNISWNDLKDYYLPDALYNDIKSEGEYKELQLGVSKLQLEFLTKQKGSMESGEGNELIKLQLEALQLLVEFLKTRKQSTKLAEENK